MVQHYIHKIFSRSLNYCIYVCIFKQGIDQDTVGTIRKKYIDFDKIKKEKIGSGGFGEVYRSGTIAVKEEYKVLIHVLSYVHAVCNTQLLMCFQKPIIKGGKIFKMATQLKHENVISMSEYIVGM